MKKKDVINAIEEIRKFNSETSKIEVKSALKGFPKKCYDTFSSFANTDGGIIIFGLDEKNKFKTEGVYDINDLQKKVSSLCNDSLEPSLNVEMFPTQFEGKNILAVYVPEITKKPCYYKQRGINGGSYLRVGDSDRPLTNYEVLNFQVYTYKKYLDILPCTDMNIDDLDREKINQYLNRMSSLKTNFSKLSFEEKLESSKIVCKTDDGKYHPTIAGNLIFGKLPQSEFPSLCIKASAVPGYELGETGVHGERFLDKQSIEGTIEEMIKYAVAFIFRNTKTMYVIDSNGERKNKHEYPMDAIKEAIINALVHRDYYLISAPISLNIFSDRIEITSPGGLYGNIKENDLENKENMELRNPSIVKILEEMDNIIENRKTGISTMRRLMKEHGLPEPEFEITEKSFTVIFRNTNLENRELTREELLKIEGGRRYLELLHYCTVPKTISEIGKFLHISSRSYISRKILKPLLEAGNLEYYYKCNIRAKGQKYVTKF